MATIAEKSADGATMIDDIANLLGPLAGWTQVAGPFQNDGVDDSGADSNAWEDNCTVWENTNAGIYLTFYLCNQRNDSKDHHNDPYEYCSGLRVLISNDWDSANNHPAGKTDANQSDAMRDDLGFGRGSSFDKNMYTDNTYNRSDRYGAGVWFRDGSINSVQIRTYSINYFIAANDNYLNIAAWNTDDSSNGGAAYYTWEYVDNKFWNDRNEPYCSFSQSNIAGRTGQYSFSYIQTLETMKNSNIYSTAGFDSGGWGIVNPDSSDDTFFFRRPVMYLTSSKNVPVAYVEDVITNDIDEGGAHGDVITFGSTDYRIFRQSGSGFSKVHSAGLRYE